MPDFETHEIGTARELFLCRELVKQIEQITKQYGDGIIPSSVLQSYKELKKFYIREHFGVEE